MQVDVRLKRDRTGKPYSTRNDQMTSALFGKRLYSLGKGIGAECGSITYSTKVTKRDLTVRNNRSLYLRHSERQVLGILTVRVTPFATVLSLSCHCNSHHGH